jgi:hypothetical protein
MPGGDVELKVKKRTLTRFHMTELSLTLFKNRMVFSGLLRAD